MQLRVRYRLGQFCRAIAARPSPSNLTTARSVLAEAQWALFLTMAPRDQWHSVETLRLFRENCSEPNAEVAALLHDAGKGYIHLHERVIYVLLTGVPFLLRRLAASHTGRLGAALLRAMHHAEAGADLAKQAGASERAVHLIRTHHHPDTSDPIAVALAAADDRA